VDNWFVKNAIQSNEFAFLKDFVTKLSTAFKKKHHKKYLIRILRLLIPVLPEVEFNFFENENEDKLILRQINNIQVAFTDSGVLDTSLNIIDKETDITIIQEAINLLLSMQRYGNYYV